jgi:hypothetical protein
MHIKRNIIIALFSSIFFIKIALCIGTLYFQCENEQLMNSLIMQLEIEHEDHSSDDLNKSFSKEAKLTKSLSLNDLNNKHYEAVLQAYVLFTNHYPLDVQYTFEVIQPPEKHS